MCVGEAMGVGRGLCPILAKPRGLGRGCPHPGEATGVREGVKPHPGISLVGELGAVA